MEIDENLLENQSSDDIAINFSAEVQKAVEEVLPLKDALDEPDFNSIDYINTLFPTEQSLSNIDEVVSKFESKITTIDNDISTVVQGQIAASQEGRHALDAAQNVIKQLFVHVKDIKERAEKSEEMVREITRDIKQLDCAKRNLTLAITTLNHLHMLVGGVDTLKGLTQKRLYGEIALPLQAISEVMTHFETYADIPQIKTLSDEVKAIRGELAGQITEDFHGAFQGGPTAKIPTKSLTQACLVLAILDEKIKSSLLDWFINLQLQEYCHLFNETEDTAWLDKIDKRYQWLKKFLLEFEDGLNSLFPENWEMSERITVQFCLITRKQLTNILSKRKSEIDCKLLLYAIQKTATFENLLNKRFTGVTLKQTITAKHVAKREGSSPSSKTRLESNREESTPTASDGTEMFTNLIGVCLLPYLDIYIESLDRNLSDLLDRFQQDNDQLNDTILTSCPDLFLFYKKSMIQCCQLDRGQSMLNLTRTFQKYLREYADRLLMNNLPKFETQQLAGLKDLQKISTTAQGLIQNFSSLLKEGEVVRFSKDELKKICCVLTTAEYCLETTQQLEEKLKEKIEVGLKDQVDLSKEQDHFHKVISGCIQLLVQDLENGCEPPLTAMSKIQWQNIDAVGDQSPYITSVTNNFKTTVPVIRDNLATSRKYFTQFCIKFVNTFIPKFIQTIYKCKPINTEGAEQLLLDTHMLKTTLLNLPSICSQINRQAPASYTKVVTKGMTKGEMILKLVMTPVDPVKVFVEQYRKLLPDCQLGEFYKVLDMKGVKRQEQAILAEAFKTK